MKPSMTRKALIVFLILLVAGILAWFPASPAYAAGIVVNTALDTTASDGNCSLREAIENANNNNSTYSDCSAGTGTDTITFAAGISSITLISSLQNINDSAGLVIDGAGVVTIDGGGYRVFMVNNGAALNLTGLTITNGNAGSNYGGAIFNQGTLVINNSSFNANTAQFGGAILSWGGSTSINNSIFSNNTSREGGGALLFTSSGTHTVINSLVAGNVAYNSTNGHGSGGGIQTENGTTVNITNVTLINNNAGGNADDGGGGLMVYGGAVNVINSTFSTNHSGSVGGGIRQLSGTVTLRNTIVASSSPGANCSGSVANGGGNLVWGDATCPGVNTDPQLLALANNGGPTQTMALGAGSSAINLADPAYCPSVDQRGWARRTGFCDSGAYEAQPATVIAASGAPQQTVISHAFAGPLVASVNDSHNNHLGGVLVSFTSPASGSSATLTSNPATSDATGSAAVTATANNVVGSYAVTASVSGVALPATFSLTNTNPNVSSILRAGSNPSNAASVPFTVRINTSVTGVDASDFVLSVGGISGASVNSVSGSGNTYTVLVNTGSGDGTLRLDLLDDDTIIDSYGQPLGGTGTGNGNYTSGEEYTIDKTPPETNLTSTPSNPTNMTEASFVFSSPDGSASFECALDGASFSACTSPASYSGLAEEAHTFQVRARDAAGNLDPSPASFTWTVDTTAPDTLLTSTPSDPTNLTAASFTFSSPDGSATFECALDGASFSACTSPASYSGLAEEAHTFQVRARDPAGNLDPSPASFTWTVDTTAPDTLLTSTPADPTNLTEASFVFSSPDGGATFECALDGASFSACSSPASYSGLAEEAHTFQVRARDAAGNVDLSPASFTWTIDVTALSIQITSHPDNPTNQTAASFTFTVSDGNGSGVKSVACSLDSDLPVPCDSGTFQATVGEGSHTFHVSAQDNAGNQTSLSYTWVVDLTRPTASLSALNTWQITHNFLVSWSGNDHLTSIAHYDVQVKEGSGAWTDWLAGTTQSSSTFNGEDGKTYTFRVRAVDAAGNIGDWSNEVATMVDTTAPLASLEALQPLSFGAFQVTWRGSDAASGVASYDIEVQQDGGAWVNWISATTQTSALFTPTIGHTYSFRVRAVDHAGNAGGWSPVVSTQSGGKIFLPVVF